MTRVRTAPRHDLQIDPARCWCPTGPTLIGTWRFQRLVRVERRHQPVCGHPAQQLDPVAFERGAL